MAARARRACPSCCTRCGRCAAPRRISTDELAELVCSNSFRSDDAENNAVGLLHEEMRRAGSLIMRAADAHKLPAGGALAVDRARLLRRRAGRRCSPHPLVELRREEVAGLPPDEWDSVIVATGPLTSPALAEAIAHAHRRGRRSPSSMPSRRSSIARASTCRSPGSSRATTRGPGGDGADYINCPLDKRAVRGLRRGAARRRQDRVQGVGDDTPYFEGCLPIEVMAARGPRDAALRADEAGRPARSAHRPAAVRRRAAAPGQCARHALQHRRLPDQAEARRAGARLPHDPRPARTPSSRGSAACTATPSSTARAARRRRCG